MMRLLTVYLKIKSSQLYGWHVWRFYLDGEDDHFSTDVPLQWSGLVADEIDACMSIPFR